MVVPREFIRPELPIPRNSTGALLLFARSLERQDDGMAVEILLFQSWYIK